MNNLANLPHAHSTYVHREKVLIFWLKNSIKLYCKESVTAGVLYSGKHLCQSLCFNKHDSSRGVFL